MMTMILQAQTFRPPVSFICSSFLPFVPFLAQLFASPCSRRKLRNCPSLPCGTLQCIYNWHMNRTAPTMSVFLDSYTQYRHFCSGGPFLRDSSETRLLCQFLSHFLVWPNVQSLKLYLYDGSIVRYCIININEPVVPYMSLTVYLMVCIIILFNDNFCIICKLWK